MRIIACILFVSILLCTGCQKEHLPPSCHSGIAATVIYRGPVTVDECDAIIHIDSTALYYHPVNLDESHKINGLKLYVDYTLTGDSFGCEGLVWTHYKNIRLNCIAGR